MMDLEMLRASRREASQLSQEVEQTEERPAVWAELEHLAARKMVVSDSAAQIKTEVAVVATVVAEEVEIVVVVAAAWEDLDVVTMLEVAEISAASEPVMLLASE